MILHALDCHDKIGKEYFIGTLPERRKNPERITGESILNWGKDFIGGDLDPNNIYFIRVETERVNDIFSY